MNRILAGLLGLVLCAAAQAQDTTAYNGLGNEFRFDATAVTGTPKQLTGVGPCRRYRIVATGTAGTTVSIALGTTSASVTTVVQPTTVTSQATYTIPAGQTEVLTGPAQAWLNAITSSGTIVIYARCGEGE